MPPSFYFFLLVLMRVAGRRTLAQMTPFDLVLLLVVSEATRQGLLADDFSVTNAFLVVLTLVGHDVALTSVTHRFQGLDRWVNGLPLVDMEDIMQRVRRQGLGRKEQIGYAVLERDGNISIIPRQED